MAGKGGSRKNGGEGARAGADASRLPAGRHGLPREFIARNQRDRILTAVVDAVAERGYDATTIAAITDGASVSRRTFYEHFSGKEECFLAAFEMIVEHVRRSMVGAARGEDDWPGQVRAALSSLLGFFASEPELARFTMIAPIAAGGEIGNRYREAVRSFAAILRAGRPDRSDAGSTAADEALVGGLVTLIARQINSGRTEQLEDLLPDLVDLVLATYPGGSQQPERLAGAAS